MSSGSACSACKAGSSPGCLSKNSVVRPRVSLGLVAICVRVDKTPFTISVLLIWLMVCCEQVSWRVASMGLSLTSHEATVLASLAFHFYFGKLSSYLPPNSHMNSLHSLWWSSSNLPQVEYYVSCFPYSIPWEYAHRHAIVFQECLESCRWPFPCPCILACGPAIQYICHNSLFQIDHL